MSETLLGDLARTWLPLVALALACLAPLAVSLLRPARARGRREADRALYRAQLAELDEHLATGRIGAAEHAAAVVEVQRRLLAAPEEAVVASPGGGAGAGARASRAGAAALAACLLLLPAGALGLYLVNGSPGVPSAGFEERAAANARADALLAQLRARIQSFPPGSEAARRGWILLGNAERDRGNHERAAEAFRLALEARFEPGLAAEAAEIELRLGRADAASALLARAAAEAPEEPRLRYLAGLAEQRAGRPESARAIWRALLADAPPEAPWRATLERELRDLP